MSTKAVVTIIVILIGLAVLAGIGVVAHIIACIKAAQWILLIAGALFFPVGVVHGWWVIFV